MHSLKMIIELYGKSYLKRVFAIRALVSLGQYGFVIVGAVFAGSEKTPPDQDGQCFFAFQHNSLDVLSRKEKLEDEIPMVELVNGSLCDFGQIERIGEQRGLALVLSEGDPGLCMNRLR